MKKTAEKEERAEKEGGREGGRKGKGVRWERKGGRKGGTGEGKGSRDGQKQRDMEGEEINRKEQKRITIQLSWIQNKTQRHPCQYKNILTNAINQNIIYN